jgi:hypothetical protein
MITSIPVNLPPEDPQEAAAKATAILRAARERESPAAPVEETPQERVTRLTTELREMRKQMELATARACRGETTGDTLAQIAAQIAAHTTALKDAQRVANGTAIREEREQRERWRREFEERTERARQARAEARQAWAVASKALGMYCEETRLAILLNSKLRSGSPFPDIERENQLRDLENWALLDPKVEVMAEGYEPLLDFGYNLAVQIVPLKTAKKGN